MVQLNLLILSICFSLFQQSAIEGVWITQDDETGKKKSEVELYQKNGKLYGKIVGLLLQEDQGKVCVKCKGTDNNKPLVGLIIVKGLSYEDSAWQNGSILDPKSGKVYDCYLKLQDSNTLKVRGYLGFSLLGRTQIWKRK